jgi:hypothetical protein
MINTNAIRAFNDKIRAMNAVKANQLVLAAQDARNLNHELETLLALIVQLQNQQQTGELSVEIKSQGF